MAICPKCKAEHTKRGKGGVCPSCRTPITIHEGVWFDTSGESPTTIFINEYEQHYSRWLTNGKSSNSWKIPKRHIPRETKQASRIILEVCGGDLELALRSLEILFTDKRWSFRNYSTLLFMISEIHATKVVAQAQLEQERTKKREAQATAHRTDWRQEILNL